MAKGNWPDRFWPLVFVVLCVAKLRASLAAAEALLAEAEANSPQGVEMSGGKGGRASIFHKLFSGANLMVWYAGENGKILNPDRRVRSKKGASLEELLTAKVSAKLAEIKALADAAKLAGNKGLERKLRAQYTGIFEAFAEAEEE